MATVLGFPTGKTVTVLALGGKSPQMNGRKIRKVRLLGSGKKISWQQSDNALTITMPDMESTGKAICFAVND